MTAAGGPAAQGVRRSARGGEEETRARTEFHRVHPGDAAAQAPRTPRAEVVVTGAVAGFVAGAVAVPVLVELVVGLVVPPAIVRSAEPVSPLHVKETEYTAPGRASRSTVARTLWPRAMLTVSNTPEEAVE